MRNKTAQGDSAEIKLISVLPTAFLLGMSLECDYLIEFANKYRIMRICAKNR